MGEISYKYTVGERQFLLYRYLLENTCKGHVATRKDIFAHFSTFDIAVDRKTLYTDMEILRGTMKLDVVYDERKKGYFVNNPPFEASELRLMVDSVQASNFITQREADEITRKIRALADKHTAAALHRPAVVSNRVHSREESVVKGADKLHEAISADSKVAFQYFHYRPDKSKPKSYSKRGDKYIVSPYAL